MSRARDPNPIIKVWPECPECHAAFVYRRCMSFSTGPNPELKFVWLWQRDCKHKKVDPVIHDEGATKAAS